MGEHVDKARRDRLAACVDLDPAASRDMRRDGGNAIARNSHIADEGPAAEPS